MKPLFLIISIILFSSCYAEKKPNVLFIAVDDLKPMLGCYGSTQIQSPNIDRIAEKGTVFLNNHCQQAVCSPSRASLMFGMRPDNTKIWDLHTPVRSFIKDEKTIAQHFKDNGYTSAAFGKIFHISMADDGHDKPSWSKNYETINATAYPKNTGEPFGGHFQDKKLKQKMQVYYQQLIDEGKKPGKARAMTISKMKVSTEKAAVDDLAYVDGQIANNAVKMIKKLAGKEEPFFVAVGFKKPHLPFVAPQKYWDLYNPDQILLSKWQKAPEGAPKLAMHSWGELKSYSDIKPEILPNGLLNEDKQRELIHGYMACVSYTDAQIGRLLDTLEEQGLADNTIIVLWGDHGWHLGDHGIWCKHSNFEQATRSPLIFSSPKTKAGLKNSSPVEFVDIYPTLCDLAGIQTPAYTDGVSLKPIMNGEKTAVKDFAISQFHRGKTRMGYSLRTDQYRYTAWFEMDYRKGEKASKQNLIAEELYDYKTDPDETKSLIDNKSYAILKKQLSKELIDFLSK